MQAKIDHLNELFQSAPPVKGATVHSGNLSRCFLFQSAPPVKGATASQTSTITKLQVSIRAPREGGDRRERWHRMDSRGFNPRPP